jgi:zinc transport system ATP-binding protein
MKETPILCSEVAFSYDGVRVLHNVSFSVAAGAFVGIFGPNGGGKTTLLKLLLGLLKPTHGEILLFGQPPKASRRRLGYVPQAASFDKQFPLSVRELVLMGCAARLHWWGGYPRAVKEQADNALERVGLLDKRDAPFGTLSGGQAQRALIARAIASRPELLLLDEPTASVDPQAEEEIYRLLEDLRSSLTILMVTHDLPAIINRADTLLCVHRTVTTYRPQEVCEHFALGLYHPPLRP